MPVVEIPLGYDNDSSSATKSHCLSIENIMKQRRHVDLICSAVGLVISIVHLCLLLYIKYFSKRKGFFLLIFQALLSILTLNFLIIGCFVDICLIKLTRGWVFFRAYVWLFAVNSLIAAYGFLIVVMCIDRYIALSRPLYYRITFVCLKVRILLASVCCLLAMICCIKWLIFNSIGPDNTYGENTDITQNIYYKIFRIIATCIQYFVTGIIMLFLSVKNILKLRSLDKAHFNELRMSEGPRNQWTRSHKTTANICILLAFSYIVFNWPYAVTDYFYTDELFEKQWYTMVEIVINLSQVLYIQLNLIFFAYCSETYRALLFKFVMRPSKFFATMSKVILRKSQQNNTVMRCNFEKQVDTETAETTVTIEIPL